MRLNNKTLLKYLSIAMLLLLPSLAYSQEIKEYSPEELPKRWEAADTVFVINFWATWCGPCVRELPEFDQLYKDNIERPVKVLMVSLDYKADMSYKVPNYLKRRAMKQEVVWLNEIYAREFLRKLDKKWRGSIPATLVVYKNKDYRQFLERSITAAELQKLIDRQLTP
ncbi:MAG TPA: TlpA disulfide reductase family protein [Flavipsychrobacter sp.]|nr:TlpA disulfide reductase family protein [Flavipsychrobacter sp.]